MTQDKIILLIIIFLILMTFRFHKNKDYFKISLLGFGFLFVDKNSRLGKNLNIIHKTKNQSMFFYSPRTLKKLKLKNKK